MACGPLQDPGPSGKTSAEKSQAARHPPYRVGEPRGMWMGGWEDIKMPGSVNRSCFSENWVVVVKSLNTDFGSRRENKYSCTVLRTTQISGSG